MIISALKKLVRKEDLSDIEITSIMNEIMEGGLTDAQVSSFLTALRMKGETIEEITACVKLLQEKANKLHLDKNVIDIVGTGGDGASTFNISTATTFVVAAGNVPVAKHGNRAASSKSGSTDVLEALGCYIALSPENNKEILKETNLCFMHAPIYNPTIKNVLKIRSEIKIRTIFNMLGPLINPSGAKMQLIGVYDKNLVVPSAHVMSNLGVQKGMTLFGECGLDEASIFGKTYFAEIKNGIVEVGEFYPNDFNIKESPLDEIKGGTPYDNAEIIRGVFNNKIQDAKKDVIVLNSALAFYITGKTKTIKEGVEFAKDIIEKGLAKEKLEQFILATKRYQKWTF